MFKARNPFKSRKKLSPQVNEDNFVVVESEHLAGAGSNSEMSVEGQPGSEHLQTDEQLTEYFDGEYCDEKLTDGKSSCSSFDHRDPSSEPTFEKGYECIPDQHRGSRGSNNHHDDQHRAPVLSPQVKEHLYGDAGRDMIDAMDVVTTEEPSGLIQRSAPTLRSRPHPKVSETPQQQFYAKDEASYRRHEEETRALERKLEQQKLYQQHQEREAQTQLQLQAQQQQIFIQQERELQQKKLQLRQEKEAESQQHQEQLLREEQARKKLVEEQRQQEQVHLQPEQQLQKIALTRNDSTGSANSEKSSDRNEIGLSESDLVPDLQAWITANNHNLPTEFITFLRDFNMRTPSEIIARENSILSHASGHLKKLQVKRVEKFLAALKADFSAVGAVESNARNSTTATATATAPTTGICIDSYSLGLQVWLSAHSQLLPDDFDAFLHHYRVDSLAALTNVLTQYATHSAAVHFAASNVPIFLQYYETSDAIDASRYCTAFEPGLFVLVANNQEAFPPNIVSLIIEMGITNAADLMRIPGLSTLPIRSPDAVTAAAKSVSHSQKSDFEGDPDSDADDYVAPIGPYQEVVSMTIKELAEELAIEKAVIDEYNDIIYPLEGSGPSDNLRAYFEARKEDHITRAAELERRMAQLSASPTSATSAASASAAAASRMTSGKTGEKASRKFLKIQWHPDVQDKIASANSALSIQLKRDAELERLRRVEERTARDNQSKWACSMCGKRNDKTAISCASCSTERYQRKQQWSYFSSGGSPYYSNGGYNSRGSAASNNYGRNNQNYDRQGHVYYPAQYTNADVQYTQSRNRQQPQQQPRQPAQHQQTQQRASYDQRHLPQQYHNPQNYNSGGSSGRSWW